MALAIARMVMLVKLFAQYISITSGVMPLVTFVTNESGAAHERGVRG